MRTAWKDRVRDRSRWNAVEKPKRARARVRYAVESGSGMSDQKKPLGKILLKRHSVSAIDLENALTESSREHGRSSGVPLASRLMSRGVLRQADALRGLAEQFGVPAIDLERIGIATADLVVDEAFAKRAKMLVFYIDAARVLVAMESPDDTALSSELAVLTGRAVSPYVALSLPLHRALEEAYAALRARKTMYFGRHARTAEHREVLLDLATYVPQVGASDDGAVFTGENLREADETFSGREASPSTVGREPIAGASDGVELDAMLEEGARAFHEKRPADGIVVLDDAVRRFPRSFRAHYQLGLMLGQAGRLHEAITALDTASALDPASYSTLKNLALLHEKVGFLGRAVTVWRSAMEHAPDERTRARIASHVAKLSDREM